VLHISLLIIIIIWHIVYSGNGLLDDVKSRNKKDIIQGAEVLVLKEQFIIKPMFQWGV